MAFLELICTASKLKKLKDNLVEEKNDSIKISKKEKTRRRFGHIAVKLKVAIRKVIKKIINCYFFERFCYKLRHYGSCENYVLKSIVGFISGFLLTYIFFMIFVLQLNFKISTATVMCSILGCILTIGLAFSATVRCIVLLTLPQFFSQRGRQALLAYAFILAISGPVRNTLNNMGILNESLACGQEQLKTAVRQIIDIIKKPFVAIKEAIKKVVKTVKEIIKKIKEILMTIKRIIMAIVKVIKAAFQFLAKIINICNKELGTPFERCTRVFENAILDCNAKLGPLFNWLCSITYLVKGVCYLVKIFDYICLLVDFISNSIIGVVIRKVKTFIRHVRTMFYVRIKFSHAFEFQTTTSKTLSEVAREIVAEIRQRSRFLVAVFNFMTSAATIFFLFIIIRVIYYRYKFLTSERFDNRYITKDFRALDLRRAKLGKETVLPLNKREAQVYVSVDSNKLGKEEKKALSKAATTLATASVKLAILMAADFCLFWILDLIKYYGRFQSKVQAPNMPEAHISGNGLLADLLRSIVKAFQPAGVLLEIDTVPCLPTPIPPNYDRYVQIATLILLCWFLTLAEPYGLRLRHAVMSYYHPTRAKQRSIWLYNHIMRSRNSFLKFARRQLRRKVLGEKGIEKITCKEYLAANLVICRYCLGDEAQTACLLCGQVFRESDDKKPIKCQTPGCPGVYCEQCYADLQNLCTICLSPIEYGDLSDISEEKDSSEEEPRKLTKKDDQSKLKKCWCCRICKRYLCKKDQSEVEDSTPKPKKTSWFRRNTDDEKSEDEMNLLQKTDGEEEKIKPKKKSWFWKNTDDKKSEDEMKLLQEMDGEEEKIKPKKKSWFRRRTDDKKSEDETNLLRGMDGEEEETTTTQTNWFMRKTDDNKSKDKADLLQEMDDEEEKNNWFKRRTDDNKSEDKVDLLQKMDDEEEKNNWFKRKTDDNKSEDEVDLFQEEVVNEDDDAMQTRDSDHYSSDSSTDYSYSYQYDKSQYAAQPFPRTPSFKDVEKQEIPDYASMESFRETPPEILLAHIDKEQAAVTPATKTVGTSISGFNLEESRKGRHIDFVGVPSTSKLPSRKRRRKKRAKKREEEIPLLDTSLSYSGSDDDESIQDYQKIKSTMMTTTDHFDSSSLTSSVDDNHDDNMMTVSYSSIDSEIGGDHYIQIKIQHEDFPHLPDPSTCIKYADSVFSGLSYEEVSESPRSAASNKPFVSSTVISYLKDRLTDDTPDEQRSEDKSNEAALSTKKATYEPRPPESGSTYAFENKQRKKVKQYYKAVKDVPRTRVEEKKPGKLVRFLRKIFPKRKRNLEFLPLYSTTESKDTTELKTYKGPPSSWNTQSASGYSSTYIGPDNSTNTGNSVSTEEEKQSRERGGERYPIQNCYRTVEADKIKESASFPKHSQTGDVFIENFFSFPSTKQPLVTKDLLSKYFVSIEDLTPTRDSDIPMNAIEAHRSIGGNRDVAVSELPEKDATKSSGIPRTESETKSTTSQTADNVEESSSSNLSESFCKNILGGPCLPSRVRRTIAHTSDTQRDTDRKLGHGRLSGISETEVYETHTSRSETRHNKLKPLKSNESTRLLSQENQRDSKHRSVKLDTKKSALSQSGKSSILNEQNNRLESERPESASSSRKNKSLQTCPTPILKFQCISDETNTMDSPRYSIGRATTSDTDGICACGTDKYPVREKEPRQIHFTSDKMQQTSDNDICCSSPRSYPTVIDTCDMSNRAVASTAIESTRLRSTFIESTDTVAQLSSATYCACPCSERHSTDRSSTFNCCKCKPPPPPRYEDYVNLQDRSCRSPPKLSTKYVVCSDQYNESSDYTTRSVRDNSTSTRSRRDTPMESGYSLRESQYNEFRRDPISPFTNECTRRCRPPDGGDVPRHRNKSASIIICACNGGCRRCQRKLSPHSYRKYHSTEFESSCSDISDEESDEEDYLTESQPTCFELPYQNNEEYLELVEELEETLKSRNRNRVRRAMQEFEHRSKYNKPLEKPIIDYDETSESEQPIIQKISQLTSEKSRCCGRDKCTCRRVRSNRPKVKERQRPNSGGYPCAPCAPRYRHRSPTESSETHWQLDVKSGEWYKVSGRVQSLKNRGTRSPSPLRGYCPYDCNCCSPKNYDFR